MDHSQEQLNTSTLSLFLHTGVAIEPILVKDVGEITRLILDNEQKLIHCTTGQFVRRLCQFLFLDFKSLQTHVKEKINKTQLLPIPLTFKSVLFPLRALPFKNIKTRGFLWVSHRRVSKVVTSQGRNNQTEIYMLNGYKLIVPYTRSFVLQQMRDAQLVDYLFQEVHFPAQRIGLGDSGIGQSISPEQILYLAEAIRKYKS